MGVLARCWGQPGQRAVTVVVTAAGFSQIVALTVSPLRLPIIYAALLVLDSLGAYYSVRVAAVSAYRWPWRLLALARASAVAAFLSLALYLLTGSSPAYYTGVGLRMAMFVLLAAASIVSRLLVIEGQARWAFLTEVVMVVSAGAMLAWYVVLNPLLEGNPGIGELLRILGYTAGDLLVLAAVAALLLGGGVPRLRHPTAPMAAGLLLLLCCDIALNAVNLRGDQAAVPYLTQGMVGASLLMTLSPMLILRRRPVLTRVTDRPAWTDRLVLLSLLAGAAFLIFVAIRQHDLFPWGGLVVCLMLMVGAVMARLQLALRSTRELVVADALTGLANRTGLENAIATGLRRGERMSLLLIDLDDFKLINDAYGHAAGDAVLTEFGRHLRASVRSGDTCARFGGDEFAVLLIDSERADLVAQRILDAIEAAPLPLGEDLVTMHASIGLAEHRPGGTAGDLLRRADLAMYVAKGAGTHSWRRHDDSMIDRRAQDAALAKELAGAAGRGELLLYLQPIVNLDTAQPLGYEALLRWQHPTRGLVPPLEFIPAAERTGLITDIGLFVLEQACRQATALPGQAYVSVNVSPQQLRNPALAHDVLGVVQRSGIAPRRLLLEITESAIVNDQASIAVLHDLRSHGIQVAIDDFGTGYSALHYLTRLPVDILKIDRSFVAQLDGTPSGAAIAEAVIRLAQVLRLSTIAEGVETAAQADELRLLGCHAGQGFRYAAPRPAPEVLAAATGAGLPYR
ncbi:bifunctional diguanylate cyclase/phosphodiesterase [Actinoplanes sp. TFC3]|uniref:putative bifunctional diguanylate cyclase/phosphodiesterase n=1 Tax=Actinoplanes sp. TFC3 TaxID=1710355 RepID=UPI000829C074|nr:bifunctional diguanylate cyclase/phosphodiesterase [Actinoplanes sp. TFC3]